MAVAADQPDAAVDPANAIYVNQGDEEPVQMQSLCMNCHENVRRQCTLCQTALLRTLPAPVS